MSLRQALRTPPTSPSRFAALRDWTFLFGPGFIVPFGNGLILGYLMSRSGLVPRRMARLGLIGGPLLLIPSIGTLVDWWGAGGTVPGVLVIPEFLWELSLGIYAAVWGFKASPPTSGTIGAPSRKRPDSCLCRGEGRKAQVSTFARPSETRTRRPGSGRDNRTSRHGVAA